MKTLLTTLAAALGLALAIPSHAWQQRYPLQPQQCAQHVPYGQPMASKPDATLLCRPGYFLYHDNQAKIPAWGAWRITPETVNGCWPRTNAFTADQYLGDKSARPDDYAGTGYDKGHLANDAHQSWDEMVEYESFLMSNMMPQLPGLNRGIWKLLETASGAWAYSRNTTIIVYSGPIYVVGDPTIGASKVNIPRGFYKIIIDQRTGDTLAFVFPHAENQGNDLTKVQTSVANIEQLTGIQFLIPRGHNKAAIEPIWPVDFKSVADAKKAACKK